MSKTGEISGTVTAFSDSKGATKVDTSHEIAPPQINPGDISFDVGPVNLTFNPAEALNLIKGGASQVKEYIDTKVEKMKKPIRNGKQ